MFVTSTLGNLKRSVRISAEGLFIIKPLSPLAVLLPWLLSLSTSQSRGEDPAGQTKHCTDTKQTNAASYRPDAAPEMLNEKKTYSYSITVWCLEISSSKDNSKAKIILVLL